MQAHGAVAAPAVPAGPDPLDALMQQHGGEAAPMNFAVVNGQRVPVEPEGSALSRFVGGAAEYLNPVTAVKGIWNAAPIPEALGGSGVVEGPTHAAKAIWDASANEFEKAKQMAREGRYWEAVGHLGGALPLIGPPAARVGETIGSGDIAGGLGQAAGLLAPVLAAPAAAGARAVVRGAGEVPEVASGMQAAADIANRASTENMARAISPQVGANKVRFGNTAARIAPALARDPDLSAFSRTGLAEKVGAKLDEAEAGLDAAADARLSARTFPTQPVIQDLLQKRARLTAEAVQGSQPAAETVTRTSPILDESGKPIEVTKTQAVPLGKDVTPAPNAARVSQIDQAINELKQLGPVARYEPLRRIREAYDQVAKVKYSPAVTLNFLEKQGQASGAADVTSALRDSLAKMDPETAKANGPYALYRSANDVLQAAEETDRVRPTVGRKIMARLVGSVAGEAAGGLPGAVAGTLLGPAIDSMANMAPTIRIGYARALARLADGLRSGDLGQATSATMTLKAMRSSLKAKRLVTGNVLDQVTSQSGSQSQTTLPR